MISSNTSIGRAPVAGADKHLAVEDVDQRQPASHTGFRLGSKVIKKKKKKNSRLESQKEEEGEKEETRLESNKEEKKNDFRLERHTEEEVEAREQ